MFYGMMAGNDGGSFSHCEESHSQNEGRNQEHQQLQQHHQQQTLQQHEQKQQQRQQILQQKLQQHKQQLQQRIRQKLTEQGGENENGNCTKSNNTNNNNTNNDSTNNTNTNDNNIANENVNLKDRNNKNDANDQNNSLETVQTRYFNSLPRTMKQSNVCSNNNKSFLNNYYNSNSNNHNINNNNNNNNNSGSSNNNNLSNFNKNSNTVSSLSINSNDPKQERCLHRKQCCKTYMLSRSISPVVFCKSSLTLPDNNVSTTNNILGSNNVDEKTRINNSNINNNSNNNNINNDNHNDDNNSIIRKDSDVSVYDNSDNINNNKNNPDTTFYSSNTFSLIQSNNSSHKFVTRNNSNPTTLTVLKRNNNNNNNNDIHADYNVNSNRNSGNNDLDNNIYNSDSNVDKKPNSKHLNFENGSNKLQCLTGDKKFNHNKVDNIVKNNINNNKTRLNPQANEPPIHQTIKSNVKPMIAGQIFKLQSTLLQLHGKLNEERKRNKKLSEELFTQDTNFKTLISKLNDQYEKRFLAFKEKATLLMERCEETNAENKRLRDFVKELEVEMNSKIQKLEGEVERLNHFRENCSVCVERSKQTTGDIPMKESVAEENTQNLDKKAKTLEISEVNWNDMYKILYETCVQKLIDLENRQLQDRKKSSARIKLLRECEIIRNDHEIVDNTVGTNNLCGDSTCENCEISPELNVSNERRSSSCPDLPNFIDKQNEDVKDEQKVNESEQTPQTVCNKSAPEKPRSILSMKRIANFRRKTSSCDSTTTTSTKNESFELFSPELPSPVQDSKSTLPIFDIFSRQKLQYKHVKPRSPRRTVSDRDNKSASKTGGIKSWIDQDVNNSSSLPQNIPGNSRDLDTDSSTSSPDHAYPHFMKFQKNSVVSNFGRLCQRRNGLTGSQIKPTIKIDKFGSNFQNFWLNKS